MPIRDCRDCPDLFSISSAQQVIFCDGTRGGFIDDYHDRQQLHQEFIAARGRREPSAQGVNCPGPAGSGNRTGADCDAAGNRGVSYPDLRAFAAAMGEQRAKRFKPQRIFCFPSLVCNNDCRYCRSKNAIQPGTAGLDALLQMIDRHAGDFPVIDFAGGEPTVYPHLLELLVRARQHGLFTHMFSNARRLQDPDFTARLLATGINRITVTLHSHAAEVHDRFTRRPGSWQETVAGLRQLRRAGFRNLTIMIIVNRDNYRRLDELSRFAMSFQPEHINFNSLVLLGNTLAHFAELALPLNQAVPGLESSMDILREKQVSLSVGSFPICLFRRKYWRFFSNNRYTLHAYSLPGVEQVLVKPMAMALAKQCVACGLKKFCTGTWDTYYKHYSGEEFTPLPLTTGNLFHLHPAYIRRHVLAKLKRMFRSGQ